MHKIFVFNGFQLSFSLQMLILKRLTNLLVCCVLKYNVYNKRIKIIILPKKDDNINVFNGVRINNIISITESPRHIHTLWVDFENSTMNEDVFNDVFKDAIVKI